MLSKRTQIILASVAIFIIIVAIAAALALTMSKKKKTHRIDAPSKPTHQYAGTMSGPWVTGIVTDVRALGPTEDGKYVFATLQDTYTKAILVEIMETASGPVLSTTGVVAAFNSGDLVSQGLPALLAMLADPSKQVPNGMYQISNVVVL